MNDDYCEDWYEEEDYSSQFPRAEEETGWGIEETMYTSSLDKSKLTPEQIANAERIAAEIEVLRVRNKYNNSLLTIIHSSERIKKQS